MRGVQGQCDRELLVLNLQFFLLKVQRNNEVLGVDVVPSKGRSREDFYWELKEHHYVALVADERAIFEVKVDFVEVAVDKHIFSQLVNVSSVVANQNEDFDFIDHVGVNNVVFFFIAAAQSLGEINFLHLSGQTVLLPGKNIVDESIEFVTPLFRKMQVLNETVHIHDQIGIVKSNPKHVRSVKIEKL